MSDVEDVKLAIMENGAVTASYYSGRYYQTSDGIFNYNYGTEETNHAIAIVGWDDNLDKERFTVTDENGETHTPNNDGGWLVKNSWGPNAGWNGYIWISYEDRSITNYYSEAVVYEIAPSSVYDNIYQHDGATLLYSGMGFEQIATVYEITGDDEQYLKGVSFAILSAFGNSYTVNIYKNTGDKTLNQGELVATKTGNITYMGYYTAVLDKPVIAQPGETYTIELIFDTTEYVVIAGKSTDIGSSAATVISTSKAGEDYFYYEDGYLDYYTYYGDSCTNFCVKLFTTDVDGEAETPQITDAELIDRATAKVSWQKMDGAIGYELWVGTSKTDENPTILNVTENYAEVDAVVGDTYYYKVRALYEGDVVSEYSVIKEYLVEIPKLSLAGTVGTDAITLTWKALPYVDGYKIYRAKDSEGYSLWETIVGSEITSYVEKNALSGCEYRYYIQAYIGEQNGAISDTISLIIKIPPVSNFECQDFYYGRLEFSWDALGNLVDGYELTFSWKNGTEEVFDTILVEGGNKDSYTYDTSELALDAEFDICIKAYTVMENGTKKYSTYGSYAVVYGLKTEPLKVSLQWDVAEFGNYMNLYVYFEDYTGEGAWFTELSGDSYSQITVENGYGVGYYDRVSNETCYFYVVDNDWASAWQDVPLKAGGAYIAPVLSAIEDVRLTTMGQTVTLKAEIEEEMDNFRYQYQWYYSDSKDGEATAIEGATNSTYTATVGSLEKKYFYCTVSCQYEGLKTYNTCNSEGGRTCITGELYNADLKIDDVVNQTYTGSAITPDVVITNTEENVVLVEGTDYTLEYADNVNVGQASVIITFKGAYVGKVTKYFTIVPKGVTGITVSGITDKTYTGQELTQNLTIKDGNTTLVEDTDYTITYTNNTNAGTANIIITFKGNYSGTKRCTFTINPKSGLTCDVEAIQDQTYTGEAITPSVTIKDGATLLEEGTDYVLSYNDNKNVGTATIDIKFKGNYSGTKEVTFKIVAKSGEDFEIEDIEDKTFTGKAITPEVVVKDGNKTLVKGTDYTLEYTNNINVGTATITITFKGNYTGNITTTFEIVKVDSSLLSVKPVTSKVYTGSAITLEDSEIVVTYGSTKLVLGVDYEIGEYSANINAGTASVVVHTKGNYEGDIEIRFTIAPKSGNNLTVSKIPDYTYDGDEIKPTVEVKDGEKVLVEDTDYTVLYNNNIHAGNAIVTIVYKGNYSGSSATTFKILPVALDPENLELTPVADITYTGSAIIPSVEITCGELIFTNVGEDASVTIEFDAGADHTNVGEVFFVATITGDFTGTVAGTFTIVPMSGIGLTVADIGNQIYTGSAITPSVLIVHGDVELQKGVDYEVTYANNKEIGTADVIITFMHNYKDKKTIHFEIVDPVPDKITSEKVSVNESSEYISKLSIGTTVKGLLESLNEKEYVKIFSKDNKEVAADAVIGTGMIANIMDGANKVKHYTIIVTGDTNGDGKINITDMIAVKACVLKKSSITGAYLKAADTNGDGKVNITDFIKTKAVTLKKDTMSGVTVK